MRIVGGDFKGRALTTPDGRNTRPTSDRAREAIFNILAHADWAPDLDGARVMDVFAGSGALGFEALSRGASFCLFVETDEAARGAIRDNVETLGLFGQTRVHRRDATQLGVRPGSQAEAFDLVFLDPPYYKGLGEQALDCLRQGGWLSGNATIVFERGVDEGDFATDVWEKINTKIYGAAQVLFLKQKIFIP
jgi:16S rRNA (guanine966-N2)-methyltransferase